MYTLYDYLGILVFKFQKYIKVERGGVMVSARDSWPQGCGFACRSDRFRR